MELELDRTQRSGYEAVLDTTVCREETLESIVPDACPDILRICDTEGVVCLRDKVLQDGRVELSGSVRAALLYLPDGEEGIRRMEVELPFSCTLEHPALTPLCRVVALPRVQGADARLINPRTAQGPGPVRLCIPRPAARRHRQRRRGGPLPWRGRPTGSRNKELDSV